MATQAVTSITCPNCRGSFTAPLRQIIDVQANPEAKALLFSGQLNTVICPQCGFQGALNAPFLYHDAELEMAFIYMPMELGTTNVEQQQTIGDLTNRLMQRLPPEARKGYLLQPRTFFSYNSLIDAILERDDVMRERIETQRRKMELLEQLRQMDPQDRLAVAEFVGSNDQELDEMFFQILDVMIDVTESQGNTLEHDRLVQHQANLLEKSSTGRSLKAQREAIETLTANPNRETLLEQLVAATDETVREALVMVGRQLLDYAFFQALTARIEATADSATKDKLIALRKEVQDIRDQVDAMTAAVVESRARLLRDLMMADDPSELALRHLPELDAAFFSVLNTNLRQAQVNGRQDVVQRLRSVGDAIVALLNEMAPPEIRLLGRLADAEDEEQVRRLLEEGRELLDDDFVELLERAAQDLERDDRPQGAERLRYAADQVKELTAA